MPTLRASEIAFSIVEIGARPETYDRIGRCIGCHTGFEVAGVEDLHVRDDERIGAELPYSRR